MHDCWDHNNQDVPEMINVTASLHIDGHRALTASHGDFIDAGTFPRRTAHQSFLLPAAVSSVTEELSRQPILATGMPRPLPPPAAPRDPPARGTPFVVIPGRDDHTKRLPALSVPSTSGRVHSLQGYCLGTLGCFVDQVGGRRCWIDQRSPAGHSQRCDEQFVGLYD